MGTQKNRWNSIHFFGIVCCLTTFSVLVNAGIANAKQQDVVLYEVVKRTSGEVEIPSQFDGMVLSIEISGGGGGGSGAYAIHWFTRTGAGGGSGAIRQRKIVIRGNMRLILTVGKGGVGGNPGGFGVKRTPFKEKHGMPGGFTLVEAEGFLPFLAPGGYGGLDVPSGTRTGSGYINPKPPQGGAGGVPNGVYGENGIKTFRFTNLMTVQGGAGGNSGSQYGGSGGNGGKTVAVKRYTATSNLPNAEGGQMKGEDGKTGYVKLTISQMRDLLP